MVKTTDNNQKRCSGKAEVLFESEYVEIKRVQGKNKGESYTVPKSRVISIRVPEEYEEGLDIRIFVRRKDE